MMFLQSKGKEQQKPMMMGTTVDEAMIYVAEAFTSPMNATVYKALLLAVFKQDYMEVINRYPADSLVIIVLTSDRLYFALKRNASCQCGQMGRDVVFTTTLIA